MPEPRRIAVLRPSALGDFIFALPALAALRGSFPAAHIVLLGKAWHAGFLAGRPRTVHETVAIPAVPGVGSDPRPAHDPRAVDEFREAMRARRFDLVLQLYGGGRHANPFARSLGGAMTCGLRAEDAPALDCSVPYGRLRNERALLLEAVGLVGARTGDLDPALPILQRDLEEVAALRLPQGPLAVLQPGANDPRRRWPPERFAAVGDALADEGLGVVLNGTPAEASATSAVARAMKRPVIDVTGHLSLSGLAGLLARAALLVSNDTGPLHLAHSLGTPALGIYWFTNLLVSAPLLYGSHRHVVSLRTRCPVCAAENVTERCQHDASFVDDVSTGEVSAAALRLLEETAGRVPRREAAPA